MTDEITRPLRRVNAKRMLMLGTAIATGIATTTTTSLAAPAEHGDSTRAKRPADTFVVAAGTQGQGGEGGEGGESGSSSDGIDDIDYLVDLAYVDGHLRAGLALYEAGAADMARTHMKHPEDELYADLKPKLDAHKAEDFGDELTALASAVESGAPLDAVKTAYGDIAHAIAEAREYAGGKEAVRLAAIAIIVRKAAGEYAESVKDGRIVETHEFQDAWGFMQAARAIADELDGSDRTEVKEALVKIRTQFDSLNSAFPALMPTVDTKPADPALLFAAAAHMELAALAVK